MENNEDLVEALQIEGHDYYTRMFKSGQHVDLHVKSRTKTWKMHKIVVGESSYFGKMFDSENNGVPTAVQEIDMTMHEDDRVELVLYSLYLARSPPSDEKLVKIIESWQKDSTPSVMFGHLLELHHLAVLHDLATLAQCCRSELGSMVREALVWGNREQYCTEDEVYGFLEVLFDRGASDTTLLLQKSIPKLLHEHVHGLRAEDRFRKMVRVKNSRLAVEFVNVVGYHSQNCDRDRQWIVLNN